MSDALFGKQTSDDRPMHSNTFVPYQALHSAQRLEATLLGLGVQKVELFSGLGRCLSLGFRERPFFLPAGLDRC